VVDPAPRLVRRSFTAACRAMVVAGYEAAPDGSKAGVLRREGLYQSQIREWTSARGRGAARRLGGRIAQLRAARLILRGCGPRTRG